MEARFILAALAAIALAAAPSRAELPGSGTAADPFRISSVADWNTFAANVNAGQNRDAFFTLVSDVSNVTVSVGDSGHSFGGVFNGNGHTLTVAIESTGTWAAPFVYIDGATISNLTVTGSVTGGGNHAAGLVGACGASSPNAIRDCTVAVAVVAAGTGYAGGIVGQGGDSTLSFEDCVFSGSVSGFTAFAGGLLGWGSTMTLNIANCLSTGAFTPSGTGKFHPVACKFANRTVTATVTDAYWINTLVPTATGGNLVPGAEGTPVSETLVPGTWAQPVTAPDGQTYYRWATAPAGRLLAHYSFDDAGNAGTNLLRAAVGLDAIVRATQTTPVAGPGEIAAVTDSAVLSGLGYADGAVVMPNGQHLAVPIPAPLLVGSGRPYTVVMRIRVPDSVGWRCLLNMPASNDSDAMVYLQQTTRNIYLKQFDKSSGGGIAASNGNVAADQWTTLAFAFGENATDVYRDGMHVLHATGALAGSYADCAASGGYILVGADDSYDDDLFYLSDFRIYEGTENVDISAMYDSVLAWQCGAFGIVTYDLPATQTTVVPVPHAWLDTHVPGVAHELVAYEAAALATAANGRKVWECYVLGLDPQVATSDFRIASFPMKADGTPDFANVAFDPPQEQWNVPDAPVVWKGAAQLEGPWRTVLATSGSAGRARPATRFFKAVVFGDEDDIMVQLWEGGPYWAIMNVGAEEPWEYGYYFWWGDTVGYTRSGGTWTDSGNGSGYYDGVTWVSSTGEQMSSSPFEYASSPTYGKDASELLTAGYIDSTGNLAPEYDAAHVHWGGEWRMPTNAEFVELNKNCTTTWTTTNGVYGRLVTGKGDYANRSIFLPAAGYGWNSRFDSPGSVGRYSSSTPYPDSSDYAWRLYFDSSDRYRSNSPRYSGQSVRPVRGSAQ